MSEAKKPGSLLDQWNLLSEVIADSRTRKPHIQIAQIVIDRQKAEHGNGRASVRYLERGTGLSKWRLSKATAELVEWGYFSRRAGAGTRPSEFTPSWPSVRVQRDTKQPMLASESGGTECPSPEGHYEPSASESGGTNPAYVDGLQAGLREAESSVGAATPPLVDALSGTTAGTPPGSTSEPFTELWNAFDLKLTNTKPKAKAAYEKLSPDAALHAIMVEAAARLHAHYEENQVERRYRIQCHNWISARGWEDDLPIVYTDAKSAAIGKVRGSGKAKSSKAATPTGLGIGKDIKLFTIVDYREEGSEFGTLFQVTTFRADDGQEFTQRLHVVQADAEYAAGPDVETRNKIALAAFGKGKPIAEWVGRVVGVTDADGLTFHHVAQPEPWVGDVGKFAPFGTFTAKIIDSSADHNECGHLITLMLEVSDTSGEVEFTRQVDHAFDLETMKGRAFLASICRAVGINSIENTDVLHGKVLQCTITTRGEISYAASTAQIQEAA